MLKTEALLKTHLDPSNPCKQCFNLRRNIGQVNPKIIYFHNLKKNLDQSIQNNILFSFGNISTACKASLLCNKHYWVLQTPSDPIWWTCVKQILCITNCFWYSRLIRYRKVYLH